ncbi:MAG TPA: UDP-glucose 4-epimerase GalE [Candidatus Saccharimonadales bacterium]|nr:UDP-glucose 4-epimerase GalE [Candidatus Saccharimonadales bacterium]
MKILVTGGAGYIGSATAGQLLQAGHRVTVLDDLSRGHREAVPEGAELVVADLADRERLDRLFREAGFDGVMHFAAFIEAGESMKSPEAFFRNNTANALIVLETMLKHGVKKFVFSSTAALFGNPKRTPIEEDDALQPTNAYGESKLLTERMLSWLQRIHGLRYASLRYFNAAGAVSPQHGEAHQPETHLIPRLMLVALGRQPYSEIFGTDYPTPDGTCVRDYIHVSDLAEAHLLALNALEKADKLIYNLGSGKGFSVREVVEGVRRVTGHSIPVKESPRRPGDPAVLIASSEKIRRELNWTPKYPDLESILESAWEWHRNFPNGYAKKSG